MNIVYVRIELGLNEKIIHSVFIGYGVFLSLNGFLNTNKLFTNIIIFDTNVVGE